MVFGAEGGLAVGILEVNVVEAHELPLPFAEELAVVQATVGVEVAERFDEHRLNFRGLGQPVELNMVLEEALSHECRLVCVGRRLPFGVTELHKAGVAADVHAGKVDNHLLTDTAGEPQVVGVD